MTEAEPKATVLIVDDEVFTLRMMQIYFQKYGFQAITAGSGEKALELLSAQPVNVILSDLMMPGMNGIELVRQIRERFSADEIPVLIISALDDTNQVLEAMEAGANDFVPKMREFKLVLARVNTLLEMARLRAAVTSAVAMGSDGPAQSGDGRGEAGAAIQDEAPESATAPAASLPRGAGVWSLEPRSGKLSVSRRWRQMLGLDQAERQTGVAFGNNLDAWFAMVHPDDLASFRARLDAHLTGRESCFECDFRVRHTTDGYVWARAFAVALFDAAQKPHRVLGSMHLFARGGTEPLQSARAALAQLHRALGLLLVHEPDLLNGAEESLSAIDDLLTATPSLGG